MSRSPLNVSTCTLGPSSLPLFKDSGRLNIGPKAANPHPSPRKCALLGKVSADVPKDLEMRLCWIIKWTLNVVHVPLEEEGKEHPSPQALEEAKGRFPS